jgi:hypothetical protein
MMDAHFVSINPIFPAEHLVAGFTFHRRLPDRPRRIPGHAEDRRRARIPPAARRPGLLARTLARPRGKERLSRSRRRADSNLPGQTGARWDPRPRRRGGGLRTQGTDDLRFGSLSDPPGTGRQDSQRRLRRRQRRLQGGGDGGVGVVRGPGAVGASSKPAVRPGSSAFAQSSGRFSRSSLVIAVTLPPWRMTPSRFQGEMACALRSTGLSPVSPAPRTAPQANAT